MDIKSANQIYFIGIGGIGVSGLARLFHKEGKKVSGSDLTKSVITDALVEQGISVRIGQPKPASLPRDAEIVIHSLAVRPDHPEIQEAKRRGLIVLAYPEAVGQYTRDKFLITVSGTHGKTTTTAMIGEILASAGLDPTVLVGSQIASFGGNARLGLSRYFVLEADEYGRAFLNYRPALAVVHNVEPDHFDVYASLSELKSAFQTFIGQIRADGWLVANADDPVVAELSKSADRLIATYGLEQGDYRGTITELSGRVSFIEAHLGPVTIQLPGRHNVMNALAAIATCLVLKIEPDIIRASLARFGGVWRRFERVGEYQGCPVISDYAHHPTAFTATFTAARDFFPDKKILVVFQPHQRHRTRALLNEFVESLSQADELILAEIYEVAGREDEQAEPISSKELVDRLREKGTDVTFAKDVTKAEQLVREKTAPGKIILVMGAGSIDIVARNIVKE